MRRYDERGWLAGALGPLAIDDAYALLSPEVEGRMPVERWQHQARRFFDFAIAVAPAKSYAAGGYPLSDHALVTIDATRVELITMPLERAPEVLDAAQAAVRAIGGAGFDALLGRAKRLWQVPLACDGPDAQAPLRLAALLASLLLAPIVPPGGGTIFGVKGARERLERGGR